MVFGLILSLLLKYENTKNFDIDANPLCKPKSDFNHRSAAQSLVICIPHAQLASSHYMGLASLDRYAILLTLFSPRSARKLASYGACLKFIPEAR
jgi:hypothetical protein